MRGNNLLPAGLGHALHAMAQPLTLLQSRLYLAGEETLDQLQARQLVADASDDVERLSMLFRMTQRLVQLDGSDWLRLEGVSCASWIDRLEPDAEAMFAGWQLRFEVRIGLPRPQASVLSQALSQALPQVRIDPERTREAILDLLAVARDTAATEDTVICSVRPRDAMVECAFTLASNAYEDQPEELGSEQHALEQDGSGQPGSKQPRSEQPRSELPDVAMLRLALATAISLRQQGSCRYQKEPFALMMGLPVAHPRSVL
jgi:hypothetical protein